jgi:hypothetical protein
MSSGQSPIPCGIDAIAARFGIFRCFEAADAVQQALRLGGVAGVRIELSMPQWGGVGTLGSIYADEGRFAGRTIATNGRHVGIEVNNSVFDNNFPSGVPRTEWLEKMQTQFGSVAEAIAQGLIIANETRF